MNPEAPPSIPSETPIVGYCRACGKALDSANVRTAHGTIYCAEHVPAEPPAVRFILMRVPIPRTRPLPFPAPTYRRAWPLSWG